MAEDPDLSNNVLTTDAAHFIHMVELISRTYDICQLQIITNITNAPLRPKSHCLVQTSSCTLLLWGWRHTGHRSHIARLQWSINFYPQSFHQTITCGFKQDGGMAHMPVIGITALCRLFPQW